MGISESDAKTLFDEFVQVDSAKPKDYAGTGLGLSISKKFCELLGGTITLESKLHVGSSFTMELPREFSQPGLASMDQDNFTILNSVNS